MQINADDIFKSLKFTTGKIYTLETMSENSVDSLKHKYAALVKLHDFYEDLIIGINKIAKEDNLTEDIDLVKEDIDFEENDTR
jgi:hypothetical protein